MPPADAHGLQRLVVVETVDRDRRRLVGSQPGEHLGGVVDGVVALPRAGRVCGGAGGDDLDAQGALAAALDGPGGRLEQHREVALEQLGPGVGESTETVEAAVDLLAVVEEEGEVTGGLRDLGGDPEHDGHAALHVDRAATPEQPVDLPRRQVGRGGQRHGVDVTGEHDPLGTAERGASDDGVAVALDLQVRERAQRRLDRVGERGLVLAHGLDVAHGCGERDDVGGQVERGGGGGLRGIGRGRHTGKASGTQPTVRRRAHRPHAQHASRVVSATTDQPYPWAHV